jgi:hypothetical protein
MIEPRTFLVAFALLSFFGAARDVRADDPPKEGDKPATPPISKKELEEAVYKAIMSSAGQIDACTAAYLNEYPNNAGTANMAATIVKDGSVPRVNVSTSLEGSRNLVPCLEKAGKIWKFPKLGEKSEQAQITLTVQVKKGVKFTMKKPGEKAEEAKAAAEPEGFMQFVPSAWNTGG